MIVSKGGEKQICLELSVLDAELLMTLINQGLKSLDKASSGVVAIPALKIVKQLYDRLELTELATDQEDSDAD